MIEVNHVILYILNPHDQIPDDAGIIGNFDLQRIFNGANTRHRVHGGADAAEALGKVVSVTRVTPFKNGFDAAKGCR